MKDKTETQTTEKTEPKARALKTPETSVYFKNKTFNEVAYYLAEQSYGAEKGQVLLSEPDKEMEAREILADNDLQYLFRSQLDGIREDAARREVEEKSGAFALENPAPEKCTCDFPSTLGDHHSYCQIFKGYEYEPPARSINPAPKTDEKRAPFMNFSGDPAAPAEYETDPTAAQVSENVDQNNRAEIEKRACVAVEAYYNDRYRGALSELVTDFAIQEIGNFFGAENPTPEAKDLSEAVKILQNALNDDGNLWHCWQSNIAMAFVDEFKRATFDDTPAQIANRAADRFLNLLIQSELKYKTEIARADNGSFLPMPIDTTALKILDHFRSERDKWREHLEKLEHQARNSHPITDLNHLNFAHLETRIKLAETQHERFARDFEIIEEIINQSEGKADA